MKAAASTITASRPEPIGGVINSADLITPVICETVSATLDPFKTRLRAIVLTGSMARGEATYVKVAGGWKTLGDCEVVLVFEPREPLLGLSQAAQVGREIELRLEQRCIACSVGLSAVHPRYLVNLQPHIYSYELRNCGRVLWGDSGILTLVPSFSPRDIPLEDAWRMVCNRMIEQLAIAKEGAQTEPRLDSQADYRTIKLCLDLATSFLLFCGEYVPTYQGRCDRLQLLSGKLPPRDNLPFPLQPFATLIQNLTRCKLSPTPESLNDDSSLRPAVWDYAQRLWRWELRQLTGEAEGVPNSCLLRRWMRFQPFSQRIRGWASLARRQGWFQSWREWPHWVRLGMKCSPRYCVYAAGSELFLQLSSFMGECGEACPKFFRPRFARRAGGWLGPILVGLDFGSPRLPDSGVGVVGLAIVTLLPNIAVPIVQQCRWPARERFSPG